MKTDNDNIYLIPEKRRRTLSGIPRRLYLSGWLTLAISLAVLLAVWLFLRSLDA